MINNSISNKFNLLFTVSSGGRFRIRPRSNADAGAAKSTAMSSVIEAGYDPVYGARPLKRAVQRLIEDPLAKEILSGKYNSGNTIQVSGTEQGLSFN